MQTLATQERTTVLEQMLALVRSYSGEAKADWMTQLARFCLVQAFFNVTSGGACLLQLKVKAPHSNAIAL